jgi:hypothetical protein
VNIREIVEEVVLIQSNKAEQGEIKISVKFIDFPEKRNDHKIGGISKI